MYSRREKQITLHRNMMLIGVAHLVCPLDASGGSSKLSGPRWPRKEYSVDCGVRVFPCSENRGALKAFPDKG